MTMQSQFGNQIVFHRGLNQL